MSIIFEAVTLAGDLAAIRDAFDRLMTPLALRLYQSDERGFVILSQLNPGRLFKWEEVDSLAASLSVEFGTSLSVHYDDRGGVNAACLFRHGTAMRGFGEADEVWVAMDEDWKPEGWKPMADAPRYSGDNLPPDEECDCIRRAIDVGLEAAGFDGWTNLKDMRDIACSDEGWLAHRGWEGE
jgi:hypothetical protein